MPILIGAIAYQASSSHQIEEHISSWMTRDHDGSAGSKHVLCPKCGEPYILIEGTDATDAWLRMSNNATCPPGSNAARYSPLGDTRKTAALAGNKSGIRPTRESLSMSKMSIAIPGGAAKLT